MDVRSRRVNRQECVLGLTPKPLSWWYTAKPGTMDWFETSPSPPLRRLVTLNESDKGYNGRRGVQESVVRRARIACGEVAAVKTQKGAVGGMSGSRETGEESHSQGYCRANRDCRHRVVRSKRVPCRLVSYVRLRRVRRCRIS